MVSSHRSVEKKRSIAIVDPGVQRPEIESFNAMGMRSGLALSYHLPALVGPGSLREIEPAAVVVLGSASSVYDGLPWQEEFHRWLESQIEKGTPTLGICYGHQLIAHLFGAKVGFLKPDREKQVGFRRVNLRANRLWGGHERSGELAVSHREIVLECPADFSVCGSSDQVAIEALCHRALPVWSFQAHPEIAPVFLSRLPPGPPVPSDPFSFGHELVDAFLKLASRV